MEKDNSRNDEKLIFTLIQRQANPDELMQHLQKTKGTFDLTRSIEKSTGHTALLYAAHKNLHKLCEVLLSFLVGENDLTFQQAGSGESNS